MKSMLAPQRSNHAGKRSSYRTLVEAKGGVLMSYFEVEAGVGCVCLIGRLDVRTVPQMERVFEFMTASQRKPVIVDLSGVELMNSIGLGMLITNANTLRFYGASMILLDPPPRVERVIRFASLDQLLPIVHSKAEALKRIKESATS